MKKKALGNQLNTLPKTPQFLEQISFNLNKQDQFIESHGVTFVHYKAIPSPIGLKDRGEYRRSDALDTLSSNGYIYKKCGEFIAVFLSNSKKHKEIEGGFYDESTSRITLPRFYDSEEKKEIYLAPGDRLYIRDMEVKVVTYEKVNYNPNGVDLLRFPALCVEFLIDSTGEEYKQGVDFKVNKQGNIEWMDGRRRPEIDLDTGMGQVYSIRYQYNAHWYINALINEVRIGNVTENGVRTPSRMPYHASIQREYVYHNKVNDGTSEGKPEDRVDPSRVVESPSEPVIPAVPEVRISKRTFKLREE